MLDTQDLEAIKGLLQPIETRLDSLETRLDNLETGFDNLENKVYDLDANVNSLKEEVHNNSVLLENTVNKTISVLYEGYQLNAQRLDGFDVHATRAQSDMAVSLAKLACDKADRLAEKLEKSA